MKIENLGDAAYILRDLPGPAYLFADAVWDLQLTGIIDAAASYDTVGVYFKPGELDRTELAQALKDISLGEHKAAKLHRIPVCYELGEDLSRVSQTLQLDVQEVIDLHTSTEYRCFAVGFSPGFPYLGWLPQELHGIPRMASPRTRTEPGSVAITGKQTGIYSLPTPGGWSIIGRTPLTIVDVEDNYFPICAGDCIALHAISEDEFHKLKGNRL